MSAAEIRFDHVHLVARDPVKTAQWYADNLSGRIWKNVEVRGAPQVYVQFGDSYVIVRGQRGTESPTGKDALEWGIDHFGVRVQGDFDEFCARLKQNGVTFSMEPTDFNESTRIAFIDAPDGVSVELLNRK
jgi:catechol 2,3-dioxygenase-like lactoylglutathione lyase family enzyme